MRLVRRLELGRALLAFNLPLGQWGATLNLMATS
jgi:hypothetical protein